MKWCRYVFETSGTTMACHVPKFCTNLSNLNRGLVRTLVNGAWHPWNFEFLCIGVREILIDFYQKSCLEPLKFRGRMLWQAWIEILNKAPAQPLKSSMLFRLNSGQRVKMIINHVCRGLVRVLTGRVPNFLWVVRKDRS